MHAETLVPSLLAAGVDRMPLHDVLARLREEGWAPLGRVLSDEGLAILRARADDLMLGNVVHPGMFFQHDTRSGDYEDLARGRGWEGPSLGYRKLEKLEMDPLFFAWLTNPLFARICAEVAGEPVALYRAVLMNKAARIGSNTPWHQDAGKLWGLDRDPILQIWTALDDAPPEAGGVDVLPGSHRAGLASALGGVIAKEAIASARADERAVSILASRGEAVLLHNHVWHRSGKNTTDHPRRAFSVCYLSARTQCMRTRRAKRTFLRVFSREGEGQ